MYVLGPVRRQWWFRTLLVLGVLAGVLGMHGLATGHSVMKMPPGTISAAVSAHSLMASDKPMTGNAAVSAHPASDGHDPTAGHSAMVACLAILAAAVALLVLLLRSGRPGRPRPLSALHLPDDGGPPRPQPRVHALTLHQLSICRT